MARRIGAHAKLLANYASDDAIIEAGEAAELLFVRGLAFCSSSDADDYITDAQVVRYVGAGMKDAQKRAARLVEVGLWGRVDGGYIVRSWLKIHPSTEEKGYRRKADRERKRAQSPSGFRDDSARNPDGLTPDSLKCSVTEVVTDPDQIRSDHSRALVPLAPLAPTNGQQIIGEWIDRCAKRPPERVLGQVAKLVGEMLGEGIDPDDVRRGLAAWMGKNLAPSLLPSIVNEVMNGTRASPIDRRRQESAQLVERFAGQ